MAGKKRKSVGEQILADFAKGWKKAGGSVSKAKDGAMVINPIKPKPKPKPKKK